MSRVFYYIYDIYDLKKAVKLIYMIKENFRYLNYSNDDSFTITQEGKIELKEYPSEEDLYFLLNLGTSGTTASLARGSGAPLSTLINVIGVNLGNGNQLTFNTTGYRVYEGQDNFSDLGSQGTISFYVKKIVENGGVPGSQNFLITGISTSVSLNSGTAYGFTLTEEGMEPRQIFFTAGSSETVGTIYNKISPLVQATGARAQLNPQTGEITLFASSPGSRISITAPTEANVTDVISFLGGVGDSVILNGPNEEKLILGIYSSSFSNVILISHTKDSSIIVRMYDNRLSSLLNTEAEGGGTTPGVNIGKWSNDPDEYYNMELSWSDDVCRFFINGENFRTILGDFSNINGNFRANRDLVIPNETASDAEYSIGCIKAYSSVRNISDFSASFSSPTTVLPSLQPYDTNFPYVDVQFGRGFKESQVKDIDLDSENVHYRVKLGNFWYYYLSGSWRQVDNSIDFNSLLQTNTKEEIEIEFADLFFDENADLIIQCIFASDGSNLASLNTIEILLDTASAEIIGNIEITAPLDLSMSNRIVITTDRGNAEVDLSTASEVASSTSLDEILQAIEDANVPGLRASTKDANNKIVLTSETTGSTSFVSVSASARNSALNIVWGAAEEDFGDGLETRRGEIDFSELFRWVRSLLGAPLVPVEITNEQLNDCLSEAVYHYNKWRNYDEDLVDTHLIEDQSTPERGYIIPSIVGSSKNIIEVILEPRYPLTYYYSGSNDLFNNAFIQNFFDSKEIIQTATDYHVSLVASRDLNNILNTELRWDIFNNKIFIFPKPLGSSINVILRYKPTLTMSEIANSIQLRRLVLALAKIVLGNIRGTFGNQIPGGDGLLQLNGPELKADGQAEKESIIDGWKKEIHLDAFILG